jgi:hypothetical protein
MATKKLQGASAELWALVKTQHGVVSRAQLLDAGLTSEAIRHRVARGRLYPVAAGVYAVGRAELSHHGAWFVVLLTGGPQAALSHQSAAVLWGIRRRIGGKIEVTMPADARRRRPGVVIHRREGFSAADVTTRHGLRVTTPLCTLIDLATRLPDRELERAVNEADKLDLIHEDDLRDELADSPPARRGAARLKRLVDSPVFVLTDSELERLFLPIARRAGLPLPITQRHASGHRVDFHWPELNLVVEVDGLRYHRTATQQLEDRRRDQDHTVAGRTQLRFAYAQVEYEPDHVLRTLRAVGRRLRAAAATAAAA